MSKGGKISVYEGTLFTTTLIVSKILYTSTPAVIKQVGTAAWYTTLISCVTTVIFFLLLCMLMNRFPGKNLVDIHEAVLGKVAGKIFAILFSSFILYYCAMSLREFMEMIKVHNLPKTPPSIILFSFLSVTILLVYKGGESIIRVCCINFFPIMLGLCIILTLSFPYYSFDYLKPYFGYGLKESISVGIMRSSAYQEVMILPIMFSSIRNMKDFKKIGLMSIVISGIIFAISFICYVAVFTYSLGKENLSGMYQLAKLIYFNRYFQRIETIFLFSWVISAVLTVTTAAYASIRVYCQLFDIKNHRPIILPFTILLYVIALIPKNNSELFELHLRFVRQYSFVLVFGIPMLLLLIAIMFRKGESKNNLENS